MRHVMLDLETLGTTADAVILSIGAVKFDLETGVIDDAGFYASVSVESNLDKGRRIDEDTLIWWFNQSKGAQEVFHEPKIVLGEALESLSEWFEPNPNLKEYYVWSNGADFDLPMLAHAYRQHDWLPPWQFYNSRCFRTYRALPAAQKFGKLNNDHDALRDAHNQAVRACEIYAAMTGKAPAKVKA